MSRSRRRKPKDNKYERDLQGFIPQYVEATGDLAWTPQHVAEWAINNGLWARHRISAVRQLATEISRAAGRVYIVDEDGLRARKYHPYRLGNHCFSIRTSHRKSKKTSIRPSSRTSHRKKTWRVNSHLFPNGPPMPF